MTDKTLVELIERLERNLSEAPHEAEKCFVSLDDHRALVEALKAIPVKDAALRHIRHGALSLPRFAEEEIRQALATPSPPITDEED